MCICRDIKRFGLETIMKKKLAMFMCVALSVAALAGCTANSNSTQQAEEYVTDSNVTADSSSSEGSTEWTAVDPTADASAQSGTSDAASSATTTLVEDDIVEPEIEAVDQAAIDASNAAAAEAASAAAAAAAAEADAEEEKDELNIVLLGDSQFDNARGTGTDVATYVQQLTGGNVYNMGIGGTAASVERSTSDLGYDNWRSTCFVGLAYAIAGYVDPFFFEGTNAYNDFQSFDPADVDYYIVEYGANDYINGQDLDNLEDLSDIHSYYGALSVGFDCLRKASPNAKIYMVGPSYAIFYNGDGFVIGDSYTVSKGIGTLAEYSNKASNVCSDDDVYYIDTMYATYFDLNAVNADKYLSDGLHYNETGRQILATTIAHFINKDLGIDKTELHIAIDNFTFGQ